MLLPSQAVQRAIPWVRGVLSERFFVSASSALGFSGAAALFVGGAASIVFFLVAAVRTKMPLFAVLAVVTPVAVAVVQHCALSFARQGEDRVRTTPTSISSYAIFEILGIAVAFGGVALLAITGISIANVPSPESFQEALPVVGLGYLMLVVGALLLNPPLLNVGQDASCSLGQEGLSIIGALFKAVLCGSRIAFGSLASVGAVVTVLGTGWTIIASDDARPPAVYFIVVDVLDSLIRMCRRA